MCQIPNATVLRHAGSAAAEFSAQAIPGFLQRLCSTRRFSFFLLIFSIFHLSAIFFLHTKMESSVCSPADALMEAFVKTDIEFRKELEFFRKSKKVKQKDWHPGCTAVVALIVRDKLFVANAGDCRTILCRAGDPIVLSKVGLMCVFCFS